MTESPGMTLEREVYQLRLELEELRRRMRIVEGTSGPSNPPPRAILDIRWNSTTHVIQASYVRNPAESDWVNKITFGPCDPA